MVPCRLNRNSCTADGRDAADDVAGGTAIHECPTAQRNIVYSHADYGALLGDAASQRMTELNREIVLHPGSRRLAGVRPQWRNVDPNIGGRKARLRKRILSRNCRDDCKAPRNKPIGNRGAQFRLPGSTAFNRRGNTRRPTLAVILLFGHARDIINFSTHPASSRFCLSHCESLGESRRPDRQPPFSTWPLQCRKTGLRCKFTRADEYVGLTMAHGGQS